MTTIVPTSTGPTSPGATWNGPISSGGSLKYAAFNSSRLVRARLGSARLSYASFLGADLTGTDFNGAFLDHAKLQGANLTGTTLDQTDLGSAQIQGAQLGGVDLSTVQNLDSADLYGAHANRSTRWPAGFDAGRAGVVLDFRVEAERTQVGHASWSWSGPRSPNRVASALKLSRSDRRRGRLRMAVTVSSTKRVSLKNCGASRSARASAISASRSSWPW
jgi:hypothetical protein